MFDTFIKTLENLSAIIPLPWFVFIGSFLEEIIAPIPSPLVMTSAGTLIQSRGQAFLYILFIALVGAIGKTIASVILYFFSDKLEDFLVNKFGKFLQISHKDTERIGKHFNQTKRDDILLFILRAIPLFPNAPISIFCGVIKLNLKTYIGTTFGGTVVKNLIYIYAGMFSLNYLEQLKSSYELIENLGYLLLATVIGVFIYRHKRRKTFTQKALIKLKSLLKR